MPARLSGRHVFIITKEISRFSRSTLDSIRYIQELLEHNMGVLFQTDNINIINKIGFPMDIRDTDLFLETSF